MLRVVLIVFAVLLLTPIAVSILLPGLALSAMNIETSSPRDAQRRFEARLEDVEACVALLGQSSSSTSLHYRAPEAACGMCNHLLSVVADPEVTNDTPAQMRAHVARQAREMATLRAELGEENTDLRRAFLRRERMLERRRLTPVQTMIDLQASEQCHAA